MVMELGKEASIVQAITPTNGVAGTTAINGATFDMQGFEALLILVTMGAITSGAVTSINAASGAQSDMSDAADLAGTGQTIADTDDEDVFVISLVKPLERYVRVEVARATQNAVVAGATYIGYRAKKTPTSHGATVNIEHHVSPAEGTA